MLIPTARTAVRAPPPQSQFFPTLSTGSEISPKIPRFNRPDRATHPQNPLIFRSGITVNMRNPRCETPPQIHIFPTFSTGSERDNRYFSPCFTSQPQSRFVPQKQPVLNFMPIFCETNPPRPQTAKTIATSAGYDRRATVGHGLALPFAKRIRTIGPLPLPRPHPWAMANQVRNRLFLRIEFKPHGPDTPKSPDSQPGMGPLAPESPPRSACAPRTAILTGVTVPFRGVLRARRYPLAWTGHRAIVVL